MTKNDIDHRRVPDRCPIQPKPRDRDRYVALESTEEEVVIFDRNIDGAWMKSGDALSREAML